jgi:Glycosyltransferase family 87
VRRSPAALAAVAVACAAGAWFVARSLQQDFAAYWVAGTSRRLGLDPYLNYVGNHGGLDGASGPWDGVAIFRHSRFLYAPLTADLFRPLAALGYPAAKAIFTAAMLAAWIGAGLVVSELWDDHRRGRTTFFVASALFFPFYRHLERGQIDLLILLCLALAWRERARTTPWVAGAALAAGIAFKPALAGLLPVVWAGGRGRVALAALGAGMALLGLTALADGPARLREYATEVVPRAALYGEGGTEEMLLPPERFGAADQAEDDGTTRLGGRRFRTTIGDAPTTASLPRLLAPETPSPASTRLPYLLAIAALTLAANRLRSRDEATAGTLLYWAAAVACVVTSPAGWVMGLVLALPLATVGTALVAEGRLPRGPAAAGAIAWAALALPAPFAGWAALAGVALIAAAVAAAATVRPNAVST